MRNHPPPRRPLRRRRWPLLGPVALALLSAASMLSTAGAADRSREVLFDTLQFDDAEALARADRLVAEGRFRDAIFAIDALLARSQDDLKDAVVPEKEPGLPFSAGLAAKPDTLYVGLGAALRRRLQALPPRAKRRYRALLGAEARAAFRLALGDRDPDALRRAAERYPLAKEAAPRILESADRALERGDLLTARSLYDLTARDLGQAAQVASRRARAASLAAPRPSAPRATLPAPWPAIRSITLEGPGPEGRSGHRSLRLGGAVPLGVALLPDASGLAVSLPGFVLIGKLPPTARGERVPLGDRRTTPPSTERLLPNGPTFEPHAIAVTPDALVALTPLARRIYGDEVARGLLRGAANKTEGFFGTTLDLLALDLRRDGAVLWTTAEPRSLTEDDDEARALGRTAWSADPVIYGGRVLCAGVLARADRELHLAGFDLRRPRLRFRTFLCATPTRSRRGAKPSLQTPALQVVDGVALVATTSGVLVAIDPASGRVLWLRRVEPPPPGDVQRPFDAEAAPTPAPRPVLAAPRGPTPLVVVGGAHGAQVQAFEPRTGRRRWRIPSHLRTAVLGVAGSAIVVYDQKTIWLADGATGRALTAPLALPAQMTPVPDCFVAQTGTQERVLVVRLARARRSSGRRTPSARSTLLLLRLPEPPAGAARLEPIGALVLSGGRDAAPIPLGGGILGLRERGVLRLIAPAQPDSRSRDDRLAEVANLYLGPGFDTQRALATLRKAGRWALLIPGLTVGGFRFETTEDGRLEARPARATKGPAVSIIERSDGEFSVRIATEN